MIVSTGNRRRSIQDLLGEHIEQSPIDKIHAAMDTLGGDPGGDTANGVAFCDRHANELCYVPELRAWFVFDAGVWGSADPELYMQAYAAERLQQASEQFRAAKLGGNDTEEERAEIAMSRAGSLFNDRRAQERALRQARPHMSVSSARFNRTPHLIGVSNGVLDLKAERLISAPATEFISKRMGCAFDPDARAPIWDQFMREVLPDEEERAFYQRSVGASLYGAIYDNGLVFMLGESGDNGKSVTCNVKTRLFGSYCMIAGADLLLQTKHDSETKRLYAGLSMGPRMVLINEIPKHAVWDDKKIKDVASRDDLQTRKLFGEVYSFTPTHHVFVRGNHAPGSQDSGDAFWKRIWPVTFGVQIPKSKQIAGLDDKIAATELSGVLNWALQGARAWREDGKSSGSVGRLILPQSMKDARDRYRAKTDYVQRWLNERTEPGKQTGTSRALLWKDYESFCLGCGMRSAGVDRAFYDELRGRGFILGMSGGLRVVRHLRLKSERFDR
jgi:putative DNA primase/helicase